jgi:hypothetical protein
MPSVFFFFTTTVCQVIAFAQVLAVKLFASAPWRCFRVPTLLRGNKFPRMPGIIRRSPGLSASPQARRRWRLPINKLRTRNIQSDHTWAFNRISLSVVTIFSFLWPNRVRIFKRKRRYELSSQPFIKKNSQVSRQLPPANNDPIILRLRADNSFFLNECW